MGALYERFSHLTSSVIESQADLQNLSLDLIARSLEFTELSQTQVLSDTDRLFLNVSFTHLRDEMIRIYECTACGIRLDDSFGECIDGTCLSIETAEQAHQSQEILEEVASQFSQCLEEE